jgi:hypothetical protein
MTPEVARTAGELAVRIERLTAFIAVVDAAIAGPARLVELTVTMPDESRINMLPFGPASAEMSALALSTARTFYQSQLDALNAQLAGI